MKAILLVSTFCLFAISAYAADRAAPTLAERRHFEELQEQAVQRVDNLVQAARTYNALPEGVRKASGKPSIGGAFQLLRSLASKHPDLTLTDEVSYDMEHLLVFSAMGKLQGSQDLNKLVQQSVAEIPIAEARRTAQSVAAVFRAAIATGTAELDDVKSVEEAIERMNAGVTGGGVFANRRFITKTPPEQAAIVKNHLKFDPADKSLTFIDNDDVIETSGEAPDAIEVLAKRFDPNRKARKNAQNLVSTYQAACAAGCGTLAKAKSLEDIRSMLSKGVNGAGPFEKSTFTAALSEKELKAASAFLKLDAKAGLIYQVK